MSRVCCCIQMGSCRYNMTLCRDGAVHAMFNFCVILSLVSRATPSGCGPRDYAIPTPCLFAFYPIFTPRAYAQAGLSSRRCLSKKFFITADLEAKTISKQEVNDEIRHILACVYLVKHRAVSFSVFSTFF